MPMTPARDDVGAAVHAADARSFIHMMAPTAPKKAEIAPIERPGARIDEVVVVVLGVGVGHGSLSFRFSLACLSCPAAVETVN